MRILLFADINSSHIRKWALALRERGIDIGILSISTPGTDWYSESGIKAFIPIRIPGTEVSTRNISNLHFLRLIPHLKRIIREFKPDIVHAHYASSYGTLGAISGFHPLVISVWGSDIFLFPNVPVIGKALLRFNFRRADRILSTSRAMVAPIRQFASKEVTVTPFGVNTEVFRPLPARSLFQPGDIVIGTIKLLEPVYGIPNLVKVFTRLKEKHAALPLKLLIVGGGSQEQELKTLVETLKIARDVCFTGTVPYDDLPSYYNSLDIYVALSLSESFGVAVLEASSCERPVVVSEVGGLPEVVEHGVTGFVVPGEELDKVTEVVEKLVLDKDLRIRMGQNGRKFVQENYSWKDSVDRMISVYKEITK
jgi:L-malate glycosyltransferase